MMFNLEDLPNAEMHRLDSGHFAVEDCLYEISSGIIRFSLESSPREIIGKCGLV